MSDIGISSAMSDLAEAEKYDRLVKEPEHMKTERNLRRLGARALAVRKLADIETNEVLTKNTEARPKTKRRLAVREVGDNGGPKNRWTPPARKESHPTTCWGQ